MKLESSLTPLEVAELLKITKNTVYELIKRGELPSYKIGKKIRVDMHDVESYINNQKSTTKISILLRNSSLKEVKFFQEESLVTQQKHNVNLQLLSNVQDILHFYHTHKINFKTLAHTI